MVQTAVLARPAKLRKVSVKSVLSAMEEGKEGDGEEGGGEEEGAATTSKGFRCSCCEQEFSVKGSLKVHLREFCSFTKAAQKLAEEDVPMDECVHINLRRIAFQKIPVLKRGRAKGSRRSSLAHQAEAFNRGWDEREEEYDEFMERMGEEGEGEEEEEEERVGQGQEGARTCSYCDRAILDSTELACDGDGVLHRCISYDEVAQQRSNSRESPVHPCCSHYLCSLQWHLAGSRRPQGAEEMVCVIRLHSPRSFGMRAPRAEQQLQGWRAHLHGRLCAAGFLLVVLHQG
jgi:hypothetical protein